MEVNENTADEISKAEETVDTIMKLEPTDVLEEAENIGDEISEAVKTGNFAIKLEPEDVLEDAENIGDETSEAMITENIAIKLECEDNKPGKSSELTEASLNHFMEAGTSGRFIEEDYEGEDSILGEEAKRLALLDLPLQVKLEEPNAELREQEKEDRYKKLVALLSESKFYIDVLRQKVNDAGGTTNSRKRKHIDSDDFKTKKKLMENQRAMYQVASEVITKKEPNSDDNEIAAYVTPKVKIEQPELLTGGTLRDYQLVGFDWLKELYENGVNGILGDDMGLGKTIQVIALLCHLIQKKIPGPFLIVGPLSTLPNWMIEFNRFAPQLHVKLFYGHYQKRVEIRETLMKRKMVNGVSCYPIIVTSYEIPVLERAFMQNIRWKYIIVDEGHRIKNYNTLLPQVLRSFDSVNRLLLTGTPLQSSLAEMWALLNFLVPEVFDKVEVFESWFRTKELSGDAGRKQVSIDGERRKEVLSTLHTILAPFMLRRLKSEVVLDLPKKKEVIVPVPMTDIQLKLYQGVLDRNDGSFMNKQTTDQLIIPNIDGKRPSRSFTRERKTRKMNFSVSEFKSGEVDAILSYYIRTRREGVYMLPWLKKVASHPYLIHYPCEEDRCFVKIDESVVKSSGKFLVLDALLKKLHARGHKVLIFSTMLKLLDLLEDYLSLRPYTYERLDGNMDMQEKADAILRFNSDPDSFLFLMVISPKGGLGINLTGADTVIYLDIPWNPQVDLQAQDRCYRIGQTKPVVVYRLVTTGTIDEQLLKQSNAKRVVGDMFISKGFTNHPEFDVKELKSNLKSRKLSEVVYPDNGNAVLTEKQLEELLDRSDLRD